MSEKIVDLFITGAVLAFVFIGCPILYNLGKAQRAKAKAKGKIYFGLAWYRIILLYLLGVLSAELPLMLIVGDSIQGKEALLLLLVVSVPISAVYIFLYIRIAKKIIKEESEENDNL